VYCAIFKMSNFHEHISIKFCVKLCKSFTETHKMMQNVYDDQCLGRTQCYDRFKRFKDGRKSVDDDPRSGRPSTSTDDARMTKVNEILRSNRRLIVREIVEDCNISVSSIICPSVDVARSERQPRNHQSRIVAQTMMTCS
jgi:hypothetical protein